MQEASQAIALAREYARAARGRDINHMPPSRLMTELAETRRQLGLVLGAIGTITAKASRPPSRQEYTEAAASAIQAAAIGEHDFAGWLAGVLATAAASLGSTAALVQGRPGSWEAADALHLVHGTVGWDDEYLANYRPGVS